MWRFLSPAAMFLSHLDVWVSSRWRLVLSVFLLLVTLFSVTCRTVYKRLYVCLLADLLSVCQSVSPTHFSKAHTVTAQTLNWTLMISSNTSHACGRVLEVVLALRGSGLLCEVDFFYLLQSEGFDVLLTSTNDRLPAQQRSPTERKIYNLTGLIKGIKAIKSF